MRGFLQYRGNLRLHHHFTYFDYRLRIYHVYVLGIIFMILMKTVKLYRTDTDIPAEVLTIRRKRPNTRSINEYRYPLLCFLRYTVPFLGGTRAHSTVCFPPRPAVPLCVPIGTLTCKTQTRTQFRRLSER